MKRRGSTYSVASFPFLAVLICAMGALILLLVVTTEVVHKKAIAHAVLVHQQELAEVRKREALPVLSIPQPLPTPLPADPPPVRIAKSRPRPQPLPPPEPVIDDSALRDWESEIARLEAEQRQLQQALVRQRLAVSAATARANDARAQLQTAQAEVSDLNHLGEMLHEIAPEDDLALLEQQLAAVQQRLTTLQQKARKGQSEFMVVAFDAQTGTIRRPILIECTATGIRFLPENVSLAPSDLEGFEAGFNPLLAGSEALRAHWSDPLRKRLPREPGGEPYILLLVRPSGTVAYYVARNMLAKSQLNLGYELIEESTPLYLKDPDPLAQQACRKAVDRCLKERSALAQAGGSMPGSGRAGPRGNGGGSSDGGLLSDGSPFGGRGDDTTGSALPTGSVGSSGPFPGDVSGRGPDNGRGNGAGGSGTVMTVQADGASGTATGSSSTGNRGSSKPASGTSKGGNSSTPDSGSGMPADQRSWESTDKFAGQQYRRKARTDNENNAEALMANREKAIQNADSGFGKLLDTKPADENDLHEIKPDDVNPKGPSVFGETADTRRRAREMPIENLQRRRWGISELSATIGMERPIEVRAEADRLIVADRFLIRVGEGEDKAETLRMLLVAIDDQARDWGNPPRGFYWVPKIRFLISPGGIQHYERLSPSLVRAGLKTDREFVLESPNTVTGKGQR